MAFLSAFFAGVLSGCASVEARKSDHFDGSRFRNPWTVVDKGFLDVLKWKWTSQAKAWSGWKDLEIRDWENRDPERGEFFVSFVNHATHLIQFPGLNVLTDPIYSKRASPVSWAGPKRIHDPGIAFDKLPRIDVVLISHNHYDHMDEETVERLASTFNPLFITPVGNSRWLEEMGAKRIVELDWNERTALPGINGLVTLIPAQHWSQRGFSRDVALWGGFVIEMGPQRVYFAGDTGYAPLFRDLAEKFPSLDLAILPIGAYEPRWFMQAQHMNPEEAVQAHLDLAPRQSMATHFGTFQMSDEGLEDPAQELRVALEKASVDPARFVVPRPGERFQYGKREVGGAERSASD
jgi:L-ascorbate metabolism protein UlaG (beta-lactamase superfamily)